MAWNGSGTFSRTNGDNTGSTTWQQDKADGDKITASRHDTHDQDLADGINACLAKNGENAATADIDFGSNGATNMTDINGVAVPTEGSYTPTVGSSISASQSYNVQLGYYASIGNLVYGWFHVDVDLTSIDTGPPEPLLIVSLPVAPYGPLATTTGAGTISYHEGIDAENGLSADIVGTNASSSFYIVRHLNSSDDSEYVGGGEVSSNVVLKGTFIYRKA